MMLKAAQKGAESAGSKTEYYDLYDLHFTGCRGCLACKRKGVQRCHCFWKDDLSPLLDRIFSSDALIIGSPIYLGDITSQVHALLERLHFCTLSYDDYSNYFCDKVNVGVILTMNASRALYDEWYKTKMEEQLQGLRALNGSLKIYPCCDTLQTNDYSRFDMSSSSEEQRKAIRQTQFPQDLEAAFHLGADLAGH